MSAPDPTGDQWLDRYEEADLVGGEADGFVRRAAPTEDPDPDLKGMLGKILNSFVEQEAGQYCECAEPDVATSGMAKMCWTCGRTNRDAEVRAVHWLVDAHPFELDTEHEAAKFMGWCWCSYPEEDPRHNGKGVVGRTSWGELVQGLDCGEAR